MFTICRSITFRNFIFELQLKKNIPMSLEIFRILMRHSVNLSFVELHITSRLHYSCLLLFVFKDLLKIVFLYHFFYTCKRNFRKVIKQFGVLRWQRSVWSVEESCTIKHSIWMPPTNMILVFLLSFYSNTFMILILKII